MNVFFLGEDVFKATLKSPEDVAQDLWIKFFKDSVMNHYIVNKKNDIVFLNVISIDDFFSLIIDFMECADIDKVCEYFRSNLDAYLGMQVKNDDNDYRIIVGGIYTVL